MDSSAESGTPQFRDGPLFPSYQESLNRLKNNRVQLILPEQQRQFLVDMQQILATSRAADSPALLRGVEIYRKQDQQVKKQIAAELVEKLVINIGTAGAPRQAEQLLLFANAVDMVKTSGFSKERKKKLEAMLKLFHERYQIAEQPKKKIGRRMFTKWGATILGASMLVAEFFHLGGAKQKPVEPTPIVAPNPNFQKPETNGAVVLHPSANPVFQGPGGSTIAPVLSPPIAAAPRTVEQAPKPIEQAPKKEVILRSEQFGFRVNSVEAINRLPDSVGIIRVAGNETALNPDGTLKDVEGMLNVADQKGLKVVFVYNPRWFPGDISHNLTPAELAKSKGIIESQMKALLKHPSVTHIEVGNEIDEGVGAAHPFWSGNMAEYAKLFSMVIDAVAPLDQASHRTTEVVLASFADANGVSRPREIVEQNFNNLNKALRENGIDMSKHLVAGHTYNVDQLEWILRYLQQRVGAKGLVLSEINIDRRDPKNVEKVQKMLQLISSQRGVLGLFHEWKPDMPNDKDYADGGLFAISEQDPRLQVIQNAANQEIIKRQQLAQLPIQPR